MEHQISWVAAIAVIAFNIPILYVAWRTRKIQDFSGALQEKDASGAATGDVSYSRVTGLIGAVVVGSLFWVMSNIVIVTAIVNPQNVSVVVSHLSSIFLIGAALFLPYAFNQLKTLLQ